MLLRSSAEWMRLYNVTTYVFVNCHSILPLVYCPCFQWLTICCCMKQCLALQPSHPQALTNLGNIYMEWYMFHCLYDAIYPLLFISQLLSPMIYKSWFCMYRNMVPAAASYYKATLRVTTGLSAPFNNLAIIYKQQVSNSEML